MSRRAADNFLLVCHADHTQRVGAAQQPDRLEHGLCKILLPPGVQIVNQVGNRFGVRLGLEHVTVLFQLLAQEQIILDNAVMHNGNLAVRAAKVRMGVAVGRAAVGCPAGVPDAAGAVRVPSLPDFLFQVHNAALRFDDL